MKYTLTSILLLLVLQINAQNNQINSVDVEKYIGTNQLVCGKIFSTRYLRDTKQGVMFLNMGGSYPNQHVAGVTWYKQYKQNFTYRPDKELKNKNICMEGYIETYRGRPQIFIFNESQIKIIN